MARTSRSLYKGLHYRTPIRIELFCHSPRAHSLLTYPQAPASSISSDDAFACGDVPQRMFQAVWSEAKSTFAIGHIFLLFSIFVKMLLLILSKHMSHSDLACCLLFVCRCFRLNQDICRQMYYLNVVMLVI